MTKEERRARLDELIAIENYLLGLINEVRRERRILMKEILVDRTFREVLASLDKAVE